MAPPIPNRLFEMQYGRSPTTQAMMDPAPRSMVGREQLRNPASARDRMGDMMGRYIGPHNAQMAMDALGWTPADALLSLDDMRRQLRGGRYGEASATAGMTALGALPIPGPIKRIAGKVADAVGDAVGGAAREVAQEVPTISTRSVSRAPAIITNPTAPGPKPDWGYETKFSNLRNRPSIDEVQADFVPTVNLASHQFIKPEKLQGGVLVAGQSDRTRTGGILKGVNGRAIDPVNMQGGQDFMRLMASLRSSDPESQALWAPAQGAMSGVGNVVRGSDKPHYFMPFTMQGDSGDYSHMMADTILGQFQYSTKADRKLFDEIMRNNFPRWTGVSDLDNLPALREQLRNDPALRVGLAKSLDFSPLQKGSLPDVSSSRIAISEPGLFHAPTEAFGYQVGLLSPDGRLIKSPTFPHETYDTQIAGEYLGGFEAPVPVNIAMPDFYEAAMSRPKAKRSDVAYLLKRGVRTQEINQKWVDQVSEYLDRARNDGISWSSRGLASKRP
jgi:hypothetical protein